MATFNLFFLSVEIRTFQHPGNAEVKNEWCYTSAPAACLRDVDRHNLTFSSLSQLMIGYLPGQNGDDIKHCSQRVSNIRNKMSDLLAAALLKNTWEICWEQV
jgi:hypothetical protein